MNPLSSPLDETGPHPRKRHDDRQGRQPTLPAAGDRVRRLVEGASGRRLAAHRFLRRAALDRDRRLPGRLPRHRASPIPSPGHDARPGRPLAAVLRHHGLGLPDLCDDRPARPHLVRLDLSADRLSGARLPRGGPALRRRPYQPGPDRRPILERARQAPAPRRQDARLPRALLGGGPYLPSLFHLDPRPLPDDHRCAARPSGGLRGHGRRDRRAVLQLLVVPRTALPDHLPLRTPAVGAHRR